jgi:polo-like kinase 1
MSQTNKEKETSIKLEPDPNSAVVEEKIIKVTGDVQVRKYYKGRLLGKGGFAKCYEFTCSENKKIFAAKVVAKSGLVKSRAKQKLISEIKIHKSLHHPQIVAFEHYFEDTENVYILLEMCHNQTLNELLKRRKRLTEIEVQCYIVQLIKALKYLHSHRVIHRDLKLGNLFLTDKMELKVGDFGLATKLDFEGERKRTVCGTPNYIAPEILDGKTGHSYEVDIWSLGVIIYTLIIGKPPFETRDVKTTYKRIKMNAYSFPETAIISEAAKNLISQILVTDPSKRPTLDQILTHDFFNQGTSIPKLLPASTLACTPSLSYIRQFMPDAGKDGIVNKPLSTTKLIDRGNNKETSEKDENRNARDAVKNLKVNETPSDPNLKGPDTWVKKWVDYSSKYGLGYLLSNGFSGVFFNDSSKIILNPKTNVFNYIERRMTDKQEIISTHTMSEYPKELQKKVTLLHHFKNYLEGESNSNDQQEQTNANDQENENAEKDGDKDKDKDKDKEKKDKPFTYVKKWMRTRHAIMFRLSNKIVQVCFQDKTEIILSSESRVVTYANKRGERTTYPLNTALEMSNYEMTKRLKYTKDILTHMLNMNQQRNAQKNQNSSTQDNTKSSKNNDNGKDYAQA